MDNEWIPHGSDDPLKAEIKQEIYQDLQYRVGLAQMQQQAQALYLSQYPQHKDVLPLVVSTAEEYLTEHPEFRLAGVPREKVEEAVNEIGARVDARLAATKTRPGFSGEDRLNYRDFEPTDENRAEALQEEMEAKAKLKEPR